MTIAYRPARGRVEYFFVRYPTDIVPRDFPLTSATTIERPAGGPMPARSRQLRRFVMFTLCAVAVFVAAVAATNWWFDPVGVTGRQTRFVAVENSGVRLIKADLMQQRANAPDVLVLGSSRSMKLDPADIRAITHRSAFNAAVSGGTMRDMYLYAKFAEQTWPNAFPHLVIGVVSDTFRDGAGAGATADPRLRALLPADDATSSLRETASTLLQLDTLKASVRMALRIVEREGIATLAHPVAPASDKPRSRAATPASGKLTRRANAPESFSADGMQLYTPVDPAKSPLSARVSRQMRDYVNRTFNRAGDTFDGVDPESRDLFVRMIRMANDHGDTPVIWITPYQPDALALMPHDEFVRRDRKMRDMLRTIGDEEGIRFHLVDFARLDAFGGRSEDFYDGIHMMPSNTRRVIAELHQRGEL